MIVGKRTNDDNRSIRYTLNEGLFAGGRFNVWVDNNNIEAEFTVYGSGVPIISSNRGTLELKLE